MESVDLDGADAVEQVDDQAVEGAEEGAGGEAVQATPTPAEIRKFKVKVDGQEREIREEDLVRDYQLREMSYKRAQEAASARQEAQDFLRSLREDPHSALRHPDIGPAMRRALEQELLEELEAERLPPAERRARDLERQMNGMRQQQQQAMQQQQQQQQQQAIQVELDRAGSESAQALKAAGFPDTPESVMRIARVLLQANAEGIEMTPNQVAERALSEFRREVQAVFGKMTAEQLEEWVGKDNNQRLAQHRVKKGRAGGIPTSQPAPSQRAAKSSGFITEDAWSKALKGGR